MPTLRMQIADLREIQPRQMERLLAEEQRFWLDDLHWDYRSSVQLIRRFVEGHSLTGCAALEDDEVVGYGFYVTEESKGLIGGLYVSSSCDRGACGSRILEGMVAPLKANERVHRIETQLMCFGPVLNAPLRDLGFRLYDRYFMLLPLKNAPASGAPIPEGLRIERWDDRCFEACAELIQTAYDGHIDSEINDQYHSKAGALKFLKNIVILPGCGEFQPYASFVVRKQGARPDDPLLAAVLTSSVSMGVGHTTQVCIVPEYRGLGLGLRLMEASIQALRSRRFYALSLTVTRRNENAVRLYEQMGFQKLRMFTAAVWQG